MRTHRSLSPSRRAGFALIEALIALLLIAVGLVAVSKLQTFSLFGSGDARMRTEAANIAQQQLEELRNVLKRGDMTVLDAIKADEPVSKSGASTNFNVYRNISQPAGGPPDQRLVQITVNWNNAQGVAQRLDLNTVLAWDDPSMQAALSAGSGGSMSNLISPTGEAQRGSGPVPGGAPVLVTNHDGSEIHRDDGSGMTWLADGSGNVILALPPKNGTAQDFTTITGRVYFDPAATGNSLPEPKAVEVRLSSEGECRYSNNFTSTSSLPDAGGGFRYFTYTCYVGPGWYGNVGVNIVATKGQAGNANICVGSAAFNNGLANGTQTSAHPITASVRQYRGFRTSATASSYQSVGMAGGSKYGTTLDSAGAAITGPFNGKPRPSDYPSYYPGYTSTSDYLDHDFLITNLSGQTTCKTRTAGTLFARNSGQYICITPDNNTAVADQCPTTWPLEAGSGSGVVAYSLTVTPSGNGVGNVTSSVGGISCGSNCSAGINENTQVVLTATPNGGSVFDGWSGACTGTASTCTVTMTSDVAVGASFSTGSIGAAYALSVSKTGEGTVTSSPAGISCGSNCSANFASGTSVTLTATPTSGFVFNTWGGACSASGASPTCTLLMSEVRAVSASFSTAAVSCTTTVSGSMDDKDGTVTANPGPPAGTCTTDTSKGNKNYECKLTAPAGTQFVVSNSGIKGNKAYNHTKTFTVSCPSSLLTDQNFP